MESVHLIFVVFVTIAPATEAGILDPIRNMFGPLRSRSQTRNDLDKWFSRFQDNSETLHAIVSTDFHPKDPLITVDPDSSQMQFDSFQDQGYKSTPKILNKHINRLIKTTPDKPKRPVEFKKKKPPKCQKPPPESPKAPPECPKPPPECPKPIPERPNPPPKCPKPPPECLKPPLECPKPPPEYPNPPLECPKPTPECPNPPPEWPKLPLECPDSPPECPDSPPECPKPPFECPEPPPEVRDGVTNSKLPSDGPYNSKLPSDGPHNSELPSDGPYCSNLPSDRVNSSKTLLGSRSNYSGLPNVSKLPNDGVSNSRWDTDKPNSPHLDVIDDTFEGNKMKTEEKNKIPTTTSKKIIQAHDYGSILAQKFPAAAELLEKLRKLKKQQNVNKMKENNQNDEHNSINKNKNTNKNDNTGIGGNNEYSKATLQSSTFQSTKKINNEDINALLQPESIYIRITTTASVDDNRPVMRTPTKRRFYYQTGPVKPKNEISNTLTKLSLIWTHIL